MSQYKVSVFKHKDKYPIQIKSSRVDPAVHLQKRKTILRKRITLKLADTIFMSNTRFVWPEIYKRTIIKEYETKP
jgi:hypothetical protein